MNGNRRKRNRLANYDYSKSGAYFITICLKDRNKLLWASLDSEYINPRYHALSEYGKIVSVAINNIPIYYPMITVPKYVVMPDHVHMILIINEDESLSPTISTVVNQMKGFVTKNIGFSIWQKLFYDHIIRDDEEYERIWQYIDNNPINYKTDDSYENLFK